MSKTPHVLLWVSLLLSPLSAYAQGSSGRSERLPASRADATEPVREQTCFTLPVTARRLFDNGDVTLVVPFTCIRGNGGIVIVNGMPVRQERLDGAQTDTTTRTPTDGTTRTGTTTTTVQPVRHCGLGDIVLRGRYCDRRARLDPDDCRSRARQDADGQRGARARHRKARRRRRRRDLTDNRRGLLAMVDGGYTIIGDRVGDEFDNSWWRHRTRAGPCRRRESQRLRRGIPGARPGIENAREALAAVSLRSASGWRVQFSGSVGLSDGAPDHGFTVGASGGSERRMTPGAGPEDASLVRASLAGDREAFAVLVSRHAQSVLSLTTRMLGTSADAEDVAQETFVSAYKALSRFQFSAKFSTWLYRIAVNKCHDALRTRRGGMVSLDAEDGEEIAWKALDDDAPRRHLERIELSWELDKASRRSLRSTANRSCSSTSKASVTTR